MSSRGSLTSIGQPSFETPESCKYECKITDYAVHLIVGRRGEAECLSLS